MKAVSYNPQNKINIQEFCGELMYEGRMLGASPLNLAQFKNKRVTLTN